MKYDDKTLHDEFRHYSPKHGLKEGIRELFLDILNEYYDIVKTMPTDVIKSLFPTPKHTGPVGTYFEEWMIKQRNPTEHYPFTIEAVIMDWYGDRSTTAVVNAVGNSIDEVLQRLLLAYILYLEDTIEYLSKDEYSKDEYYARSARSTQEYLNNITNTIKKYGK